MTEVEALVKIAEAIKLLCFSVVGVGGAIMVVLMGIGNILKK